MHSLLFPLHYLSVLMFLPWTVLLGPGPLPVAGAAGEGGRRGREGGRGKRSSRRKTQSGIRRLARSTSFSEAPRPAVRAYTFLQVTINIFFINYIFINTIYKKCNCVHL